MVVNSPRVAQPLGWHRYWAGYLSLGLGHHSAALLLNWPWAVQGCSVVRRSKVLRHSSAISLQCNPPAQSKILPPYWPHLFKPNSVSIVFFSKFELTSFCAFVFWSPCLRLTSVCPKLSVAQAALRSSSAAQAVLWLSSARLVRCCPRIVAVFESLWIF